MKLIIEYGTGKNTIIISKVSVLSELPFGYEAIFSDNSVITIDKDKVHSMEILPDA